MRHGAPCILDEPGIGVCLDCGQSAPYQNFGHDPKIGLCLDGCHFFGMPMNSSQLKFIFLANVGQIMGNQYLNQNFGYPML